MHNGWMCHGGSWEPFGDRRAPDADRAALRGLVRDMKAWLEDWIAGDSPKDLACTCAQCTACKALLTRATDALAGEPGEGGERIEALKKAAGNLLTACEIADEDGDLSEQVDGTLLDAVREALYPEKPQEAKP
jgi:hypothetical protein